MLRKIKIVLVGLVGLLVILGLVMFAGNDGPARISSVEAEILTFEGGQFSAGTTIQARELNRDGNPDLRMEMKLPDEEGAIHIWNNDESAYYLHTPSSDSWLKISEDNLGEDSLKFSGLADNLQNWAKEYGEGSHKVEYQGHSMEIRINEVNPDLSDELFKPPEDAEIQNYNDTNK